MKPSAAYAACPLVGLFLKFLALQIGEGIAPRIKMLGVRAAHHHYREGRHFRQIDKRGFVSLLQSKGAEAG